MFILHLWITENQEQSHIQSCDLSQPHGQEEHTCAAVWAHTTGQHTPKKEPQSDFITFSSAFYNNKKKKPMNQTKNHLGTSWAVPKQELSSTQMSP